MMFKKYFKLSLIIFLSMTLFFGTSYLYLNKNMKTEQKPAEKKEESVPYYEKTENCGIVFYLPNEVNILIYLDFEKEMSYIIDISGSIPENFFGYPEDFKMQIGYYTATMFIDRIGGIDIISENETLRFTGVQVCDAVRDNNSALFVREVIEALCKKIGKVGLSAEDMVFLIKNSETDLTVPVCLYWQGVIDTLISNAVFVNWE